MTLTSMKRQKSLDNYKQRTPKKSPHKSLQLFCKNAQCTSKFSTKRAKTLHEMFYWYFRNSVKKKIRNCKRHKVDKHTASSTFKLSSVISQRVFSLECNVKDFVF